MKELVTIQAALKAPKDLYNSFGKYKYRSTEGILKAVKPLLQEQNCHLTITDEVRLIGERYYVTATAALTNAAGERVEVSASAREPKEKKGMDESQVTGMASSYARKYALNALFAIDDTPDADTTTGGGEEAEPFLEEALCMIRDASSIERLTAIWNDYTALHNHGEFKKAITAKKNEIRRKP